MRERNKITHEYPPRRGNCDREGESLPNEKKVDPAWAPKEKPSHPAENKVPGDEVVAARDTSKPFRKQRSIIKEYREKKLPSHTEGERGLREQADEYGTGGNPYLPGKVLFSLI